MVEMMSVLVLVVTLELFNLGISVVNARGLGEDAVARRLGRSAHERMDRHMEDRP